MRSTSFLLTACLLTASCGCGSDAHSAVPDDPGRLVVLGQAVTDDAVERVVVLGDVQGEVEVRIFAQVPERVRVLHVQEGQAVREGDPIAELEADIANSGVAQAGAAVSVASTARNQLRTELERAERLAASGAIPAAQVDNLRGQLRTAQAQVTQLAAARRTAGAQRDRTVIRAPADGVIAQLAIHEGDMVAPTFPIASVVRVERVKIALRLVEQDYVRVREGMTVDVALPALGDVHHVGTVTRVSPVIDRLTRTALAEVTVDNADGVFRPGMVARASVEVSRRPGVTMVPSTSVLITPDTDTDRSALVFVADGEYARRRAVHLGDRFEDFLEIRDGVTAGDAIIVEGQQFLRDGSRIRVSSSQSAERAETITEAP